MVYNIVRFVIRGSFALAFVITILLGIGLIIPAVDLGEMIMINLIPFFLGSVLLWGGITLFREVITTKL